MNEDNWLCLIINKSYKRYEIAAWPSNDDYVIIHVHRIKIFKLLFLIFILHIMFLNKCNS